jgi:hypothetical protein
MNATLLYCAATLLVLTALIHSVVGERRILRPVLDAAEPGPRILKSPLAQAIIRFAWHFTSISWLAVAAVFAILAGLPAAAQSRAIVIVLGASFLLMAGISIAISRGRHIGWPLLAAIGLTALAALVVGF